MIFVLRLVHIIGGVFWVGSVMFAAVLLAPTMRALGPGAGPVMNQLVKVRKMPMILMISSFAAVGSGIWLFLIDMSLSQGAFMRTGTGMTFGIGGVLAILGLIIGMSVNAPASKRMAAIGTAAAARGGPPSPEEQVELQRLQRRLSAASNIVTALLVLATGAMAIARYVP